MKKNHNEYTRCTRNKKKNKDYHPLWLNLCYYSTADNDKNNSSFTLAVISDLVNKLLQFLKEKRLRRNKSGFRKIIKEAIKTKQKILLFENNGKNIKTLFIL